MHLNGTIVAVDDYHRRKIAMSVNQQGAFDKSNLVQRSAESYQA
jgi:hypothetical protein